MMAEQLSENAQHSTTTLEPEPKTAQESTSAVRLVLKKPKKKKKVGWTEETVDNEHMNKKKSKCCCVYKKPHVFGESSSDTDDECSQCYGHVEIRNAPPPPSPAPSDPPV